MTAPGRVAKPAPDADVAAIWARIVADPLGAGEDIRRLVNAVRFARAGLVKVSTATLSGRERCRPDRDDDVYCGNAAHVEACINHCPARIAYAAIEQVGAILAGEISQ